MVVTKLSKIIALLLCLLVVACCSLIVTSVTSSVSPPIYDYTIVLDAGHGGIDGGVTGSKSGVVESDLNLLYTMDLGKLLSDSGFKVEYTRTNKGGLYGVATKGFKRRDMQKRREIIQNVQADMVVSVHMNHYSAASRSGPQVFYLTQDQTSEKLADCIQQTLNDFTGNKHSALSGEFFICKCADCPSVIVECGFLSNPGDELKLQQEDYRKQLVEKIFSGIMLYLYRE